MAMLIQFYKHPFLPCTSQSTASPGEVQALGHGLDGLALITGLMTPLYTDLIQ